MAKIIGYFDQAILNILALPSITTETPIFIGESNIEHIKKRHPYEYDKYFSDISTIIATPDYIGINPSDSSIAFVKEYKLNSEYVKVAVRVTTQCH